MNTKTSEPVQQPQQESLSAPNLSRRRFFRTAALSVAGGGAALAAGCEYKSQLFLLGSAPTEAKKQNPEWQEAQVRSYRPLGRTGMQMSDISFGCAGLDNVAVVKRALERGVTYFDTSPDYSRAGSEHTLGESIKGHPRDKLFIVSKFCTPDGHLSNDTPVKDVVAAVEASLQRLDTDYLDLAHIHACDSLDRLMNPNIHEACDRLKEQGKLRFLGVSSHTPHLETVMRHAVDSGRFDVIMVAYNFKNCKWVLSNQNVSGLVVSINSLTQIDEYLHASGQPLQQADVDLLEKYDRLVANDYCRPGCGACLSSCPYEVPINDVLRYAMYYENYSQQRVGMEAYARIPAAHNASQCVDCKAPCQQACPFEIPIKEKMLRADQLLRFV